MRAPILVDLLLELNVINVKDIDREMNQLAAGVSDPRAASWMKRVARYFVINVEQLLEPKQVKAASRGGYRHQETPDTPLHTGPTKYHLHPSGKWMGAVPYQYKSRYEPVLDPKSGEWDWAEKRETIPPEKNIHGQMPSGLEPEAWKTQLHQPEVRKDIERNFTPFAPKKAKAKGMLWGPPTKDKLDPWMKDYKKPKAAPPEEGTPEQAKGAYHGQLYHFDPIVVRRRELFLRLHTLVDYLNWVHETSASTPAENDVAEIAQKKEANLFMVRLEKMRTADIEGFNEVMKQAEDFGSDVENDPEKFSKVKPELVYTFDSGYRWVRLTADPQMVREGQRMNHCVKNDTYRHRRDAGTHDYYSLRDTQGIPHATIEVDKEQDPRAILQVKSNSNSKPAPEYQPYLVPFFNHMGFRLIGDEYNVDDAAQIRQQ